jgi:uncharacterized protein
MQQYVIIAYDGKDAAAIDRRMAARPEHLEGVKALKALGNYVKGGAILDNMGKMIGSVMMVNFKTRQDLDLWLAREPYVIHNVWKEIEIRPFKVAEV